MKGSLMTGSLMICLRFTSICIVWAGFGRAESSADKHSQLVFTPTDALPPRTGSSEPDESNLIFASFAGLLQVWPNSFAYSGHSIIPGVIPRSTKLYHGAHNGAPPPQGMEWLAFDPDMSYYVHSNFKADVRIYTYIAKEPLRVIYLDGQSAAVNTPGFLDSQSILINGTIEEQTGGAELEYERGRELCKLGKKWGFHGVVRMCFGFELIWCDFKQGIELIGHTNATDPFSSPTSSSNPSSVKRPPFYARAFWFLAQAGTRAYWAPGETRVRLDPRGFISFYDKIDSLAQKRRREGTQSLPRSRHRLYGISRSDAKEIQDRLVRVLERKNAEGWEPKPEPFDWRALVHRITQTYSDRLVELAFVLKKATASATETAVGVRQVTYSMLMPYLDASRFNGTDLAWIEPSVERCATGFTSKDHMFEEVTESIEMLIDAIEGTLSRLCGAVASIFGETIQMDLPSELPETGSELRSDMFELEGSSKIEKWRAEVDGLMKWLGWSTWDHCDPPCAPDEICLPPVWPTQYGTPITDLIDQYPFCQNSAYTNGPKPDSVAR